MSRKQIFLSMCSIVFLMNFTRIMFAPLLIPIQQYFNTSATAVGLLATLVWVGSAVPRLPAGYLLTRVPRHTVITAASALLVLSPLLGAMASSLPMLWACAFIMGLSSGVYFVTAKPLLSDLFPSKIGSVIGLHGSASQFASVVAPVFVAAVLLVAKWRLVFVLVSGGAAVVTVLFVLIKRNTTLPKTSVEDRELLDAARRHWRIILVAIAFTGLSIFTWNGLFNFYVSYLVTTKSVNDSVARVLLSLIFVAGVPAFTLAGRLADRVSLVPLILSNLVAFAICVIAFTVVTGLAQLIAVSIGMGFLIISLSAEIDTYVLGALPDGQRTSTYAIFSTIFMFFSAVGGVIVGILLDAGYTFASIFQFFGIAILCTAVFLSMVQLTIGLPSATR